MYSYRIAPCKYCDRRTIGCHGRCNQFKEWKESENKAKKTKYISNAGYYHDCK